MTPLNESEHSFELANDSVMIRTMEGRINSWNRRAVELYGWRKEEAVGRISHDLLRTQFPKSLPEIESELVRNRQWQGKLVHTTRDGGLVAVESRWTLDLEGESGAVVEINRRSSDGEIGSDARTNADTVEIARQNPVSTRKIKVDDLLPKIANVVLAGGAFFCILMAYYSSTRYLSDSIGKVLYYFVPIGMAGLLFASLRLKPSHKINLAILCMSLAASVFGMELFVQWLDSTPKKPVMSILGESRDKKNDAAKLSKKFGVQIDTRSAGEVIADLNKRGLGAVPFVSPGNNLFMVGPDGSIKSAISVGGTEVIALAGISNKLTVLCNENGQWVSYRSDEHGFNNPSAGIWQSAGVDVAAFGDSFTQGYCVPSDKSFMGLIRQRYPRTQNLGIAGDGPLMMLATIKEYLSEIRPKIVLWVYCEDNDLIDLQNERKNGLLTRYLKDDFRQNLVARQPEIDDAMTKDIERQKILESERRIRRLQGPSVKDKLIEAIKLTALREKLNMAHGMEAADLQALTDMEGPNLKLFAEILAQAKARVDASNGKFFFVYLPAGARYANILLPEIKQSERVLSIVNSLQVPIIDIRRIFQAQGDPLSLFPFRQHGHYNETGHRLVAEEILKVISQ